jgi:hypothetical protein
MTSEEKLRLALVDSLLAMTMPLAEVMRQLAAMSWDYEGVGVPLTKQHLSNVLGRYLRGEISEADIEMWANQVEGRDDVQIDPSYEPDIKDVLHELANPVLTHVLDLARAEHLVGTLNST